MKASVFIATSLDGFIARPDGNIDWLMNPEYDIEGEDFGYTKYIKTVDTIVMGRNSYDKVLTFDMWLYTIPVFVATHRPMEIPEHLSDKQIHSIEGPPKDILDKLSEKGFTHLYIDGGKTLQDFLNAGLIEELTITQIPVLLGEGIPLFGPLGSDIKLELIESLTYPNSFVQNTFRVIRD